MKQKLFDLLQAKYPDVKELLLHRYINKYVDVLIPVIKEVILMRCEYKGQKELVIPVEDIKREIGRAKIKDKTIYIWNMFQSNEQTSLLLINLKGYEGKYSRGIINPIYKGEVMDAINSLLIELNPKILKELDDKANNSVPVDPKYIDSYIKKTRQTLAEPIPNVKFKEILTENLTLATQLKSMVKTDGSEYWLDEYWEEHSSGRIYGHGLSLQRIRKEIRHACLGPCHKYDFKACSFAVMTGLALKINPTLQVETLKDYVKYRKEMRERIGARIGVSSSKMKKIFTAIGFGAQIKDNPYSYVKKELGDERYKLFINDYEVKIIKTALAEVNKTIIGCDLFKGDTFTFMGRTWTQTDPKQTTNQKLSWIYQAMESKAISMFIERAEVAFILATHDCLYFKKPLPRRVLENIHFDIQREFPLLAFEHEKIIPIMTEEDFFEFRKTSITEVQLPRQQHQRFIQREEVAASDYEPIGSTIGGSIPKKMEMSPWGLVPEGTYSQHQK
jgi:hypothetical protein